MMLRTICFKKPLAWKRHTISFGPPGSRQMPARVRTVPREPSGVPRLRKLLKSWVPMSICAASSMAARFRAGGVGDHTKRRRRGCT